MTSKRSDAIDSFRGISVAGVLAYHYTQSRADDFAGVPSYSKLFDAGSYGVHLFFVISGLVIAMTVEKSPSALDFAVKRMARLWPAFLVAATITFVAMHLFGPPLYQVSWQDYFANWTMVAPAFGRPFVDGVYWSLLPEIRFYAITALSILILRQYYWVGIIVVGIAGVLLRPSMPMIADRLFGARDMGYFIVGMSGYYWMISRRLQPAIATGLAGAILFVALPSSIFKAEELSPFSLHVGVGVAICVMFSTIALGGGSWGPLPWLGRISYSLYLLHNRLGMTFIQHLKTAGAPEWLALPAGIAAAIGLAWCLHHWVELPGQRLVLRAWAKLAPRPRASRLSDAPGSSETSALRAPPECSTPAANSPLINQRRSD